MADNTMKPCPFCGQFAVFSQSVDGALIRCSGSHRNGDCPVGPSVYRETFKEAQDAWNTRAAEEAIDDL